MKTSLFLVPLTVQAAFLFGGGVPSRSVRLDDGVRLTVLGDKGPPVIFSSGLFGLMPTEIYSEFTRMLTRNLTLAIIADATTPVTAEACEKIADALAVDRCAFFAHSSFDARILNSQRLKSVVLCDPIVLPELDLVRRGGLRAPTVGVSCSVLELRAEIAYDEDNPASFPEYITPRLVAGNDGEPAYKCCSFQNAGHADLLDDSWASVAPRIFPWIRGAKPAMQSFEEWSAATDNLESFRSNYRSEVAEMTIQHILSDT